MKCICYWSFSSSSCVSQFSFFLLSFLLYLSLLSAFSSAVSSSPQYSDTASSCPPPPPPPRMIRIPYRIESNEMLKLPDSVSFDETSLSSSSVGEVEKQSESIAASVLTQINSTRRGRIFLGITEFTHPKSNETSPPTRLDMSKKAVDDIDVEKYLALKEFKRQKIIYDVRVLRKVGLVIIDFNSTVDAETIRDTIKHFWLTNRNLWFIEADSKVDMREVEQWGKAALYDGSRRILNDKIQTEEIDMGIEEHKYHHQPLIFDGKMKLTSEKMQNLINDDEKVNIDGLRVSTASNSSNSHFFPNDVHFNKQWGLHNTELPFVDIRASEAWKIVYSQNPENSPIKRRDILVAHIDTGIDINHPDLKQNIWINPNEIPFNGIDDDENGFIDDVHGWNFKDNNNNINDMNGHGTHTAGILGAVGNNYVGVAGVVWDVKLMVLKFLSEVSDAVEAIDYSLQQNARISTNSWGFNQNTYALQLAVKQTETYGQLFVCAVDNKGRDNTWFNDFPPNYDFNNLISVASINNNAELEPTSDFSATKVDLVAPGTNIVSTVPKETIGRYYGIKSGTSMAAPFVSGLGSLLLSLQPNLTAIELKDIICRTVTPLTAIKNRIRTGGMINAEQAVMDLLKIPYIPSAPVSPLRRESNGVPNILSMMGRAFEMLLHTMNYLLN